LRFPKTATKIVAQGSKRDQERSLIEIDKDKQQQQQQQAKTTTSTYNNNNDNDINLESRWNHK